MQYLFRILIFLLNSKHQNNIFSIMGGIYIYDRHIIDSVFIFIAFIINYKIKTPEMASFGKNVFFQVVHYTMNKYSIILLVGIAAVGLASDELEYRPIKVGT